MVSGRTVVVEREWAHQPWGIRLCGGCDLEKPLVVTRAASGSPAEKVLRPGDVILQIEDYDARDIRHQDALMLFQNATHSIRLVIHREGGGALSGPPSRERSVDKSRPSSALSDHGQHLPSAAPLINPAIIDRPQAVPSPTQAPSPFEQNVNVTEQPYRTTPLVLPGAKVKRDTGHTESYLRHHPNPMFRQGPSHSLLPQEVAMKQKVADSVLTRVEEEVGKPVIHQQFNSPIGLYSEQNILDTISSQTGGTVPERKSAVFDPSKSETLKALHDEELGSQVQEVTPILPKVFNPPPKKSPAQNVSPLQSNPTVLATNRCSAPQVNATQTHHVNSVGAPADEIQQSYTFKRLMHLVQGEEVH